MTTIVQPICLGCKHFDPNADELSCAAFSSIPKAIVRSEADHRQPYVGDNGIRFEPIADADADYADILFPGAR